MIEDILAGIPIGFFLAFLLGPVFFALLETSALKGFRAALALDLGVIFGDIVFLVVAFLGTTAIIEKLKDDPGLYIFGGVLLCAYGVISFIKTKMDDSDADDVDEEIKKVKSNNYPALFVKGFLLNVINIGVLGFWLGLIVVFAPQLDNETPRIITFFSSVLVSYLVVDIFKILLAKRLNKKLTPYRIFFLKRAVAILMIVCGTVLILKGAFPNSLNQIEEQILPPVNGEAAFNHVSPLDQDIYFVK